MRSWPRGSRPVLLSEPRFVEAVEAARELEARRELAGADTELAAFVTAASALDAALFQRWIEARQARVDIARQRVATLSPQARALPLGGTVSEVGGRLDPIERRAVLAGYLDRVLVRRGASSALAENVGIVWADGTIGLAAADAEARALVAAA
jgi:hypothetical protein